MKAQAKRRLVSSLSRNTENRNIWSKCWHEQYWWWNLVSIEWMMIAFQYVWSAKLAAPGPELHLCARSSGLIIPAGPKIRTQCLDWEPIQRLNTLLLGEECKMYPNLMHIEDVWTECYSGAVVYSNCLSKIIPLKNCTRWYIDPDEQDLATAPVCLRLPLRFSHGFGPFTPILPKETSKTTGDWGGRCFYFFTIKDILSYYISR